MNLLTHVVNSADSIIFSYKSHFNEFYASFCVGGEYSSERTI